MIHDIHSHTYYSMCGRDDPHLLAEIALHDGIEILGISDHNYGIRPERYEQYCTEIHALRDEFTGKLKILCGIEINTLPCRLDPPRDNWTIPDSETLSAFDYCLVEHLDHPESVMQGDILSFAAKRKTRVGIAHTDLFGFCQAQSLSPAAYFAALADAGIFWEMNVNFDSIHGWREHAYVRAFMESTEQQAIVRSAGLCLSVGFDSHRVLDYDGQRVIQMHRFLNDHHIPVIKPECW